MRPTRLGARSPRFVNPLWPIQHRYYGPLSRSLSLSLSVFRSVPHLHSILFEGSPLSLSRVTHSLLTLTQRAAAAAAASAARVVIVVVLFIIIELTSLKLTQYC